MFDDFSPDFLHSTVVASLLFHNFCSCQSLHLTCLSV